MSVTTFLFLRASLTLDFREDPFYELRWIRARSKAGAYPVGSGPLNLNTRPASRGEGLLVQLASYRPVREGVVVDVYVVAGGVLDQLQAQRAGYLNASTGGALRGRVERRDHGAGFPAQAQVDVGRRGWRYALDLKRVAHLRFENLEYSISGTVEVARTRHLLLARQVRISIESANTANDRLPFTPIISSLRCLSLP